MSLLRMCPEVRVPPLAVVTALPSSAPLHRPPDSLGALPPLSFPPLDLLPLCHRGPLCKTRAHDTLFFIVCPSLFPAPSLPSEVLPSVSAPCSPQDLVWLLTQPSCCSLPAHACSPAFGGNFLCVLVLPPQCSMHRVTSVPWRHACALTTMSCYICVPLTQQLSSQRQVPSRIIHLPEPQSPRHA